MVGTFDKSKDGIVDKWTKKGTDLHKEVPMIGQIKGVEQKDGQNRQKKVGNCQC